MQNKKGFTLVELIVVITILAILGTIAFISLQGFSGDSRDSKRISDLGQIRTGLQIEQAKKIPLPMPDEAISVGSGGTIYIYQGYAGTGILNSLRVSEAKDPIEDEYYTYITNGNQSRFQLIAMLENGETISKTNIIPETYANYENRYAYSVGDSIGTLLDGTTKAPVHQLINATDIDLSIDTTTEYIPVFKNGDNQTFSGSNLVIQLEENINNLGSLKDENNLGDVSTGPTTGDDISTISSEEVLYAGEYQGRNIFIAGTENNSLQWKTENTTTNNSSNKVDGSQNTGTFNSKHPASYYCQQLNWGGFDDWYLPAMSYSDYVEDDCSNQLGELQFLYCKNIGGGSENLLNFSQKYHWSSNEINYNSTSIFNFENGNSFYQVKTSKYSGYVARCIRSEIE